jgi:hypothetical protein
LLTGAAVAPALPATAAATTAPPEPIAGPTEAPELLELGGSLAVLSETLSASIFRHDEARATYEQTRPALPEEIIAPPHHRRSLMVEETSDLPGGRTAHVYVSKRVRSEIILNDIPRTTREGRRLRRIARIAQAYEAADRRAWEASRQFELSEEFRRHAHEYLKAVRRLFDHQPTTTAGALIFARAIAFLPVALTAAGYGSPIEQIEYRFGAELAAFLIDADERCGSRCTRA